MAAARPGRRPEALVRGPGRDLTGFCYDERCLAHDNGSMLLDERVRGWLDVPHPERPERLTRTVELLERAGVLARLERVPARETSEEELLLVHSPEHVAAIREAHRRGGVQWVGPEARVSEGSWQAALLAVGGLLETVERVAAGSLHQDDLYPKGLGAVAERGEGAGEGATVNVPLPAGSGDAAYELAFEQVVAPALRRFEPDFVLVSAGQDAAASDPLGRMSVTTEGFRALAAGVKRLAEELCAGRLVAFQEGGYSLDHLPLCTLAIIEALAGLEPSWPSDPLELDVPAQPTDAEREAVVAAATAAGLL